MTRGLAISSALAIAGGCALAVGVISYKQPLMFTLPLASNHRAVIQCNVGQLAFVLIRAQTEIAVDHYAGTSHLLVHTPDFDVWQLWGVLDASAYESSAGVTWGALLKLSSPKWDVGGFEWYGDLPLSPTLTASGTYGAPLGMARCVRFPIWVLGLALLIPLSRRFVVAVRRRARVRRGRCPECAYDLTLNESGVCPECGTRVTPR